MIDNLQVHVLTLPESVLSQFAGLGELLTEGKCSRGWLLLLVSQRLAA